MTRISDIVEYLEGELADTKEQVAREISEIFSHLKETRAKTRLRPKIMQKKGFSSFSICWLKYTFFDHAVPRATRAKFIKKGRGYLIPKSRLLAQCRNCEDWEGPYILEKEAGFAKTRKLVDLYSKSILALKQIEKEKENARRELEGRG